ncbi:hypothetical protein BHE74_00033371 [Ensete ventricosum]|nr:hypothetical protein GW17_00017441 [Ensete ventricosum]RWW59680.1 hypothetical protein BHE74_00033371 [Ensete ventricosum]RZR82852.1 hypothetical protein BHM03_00009380 [Ensete ventricosum]
MNTIQSNFSANRVVVLIGPTARNVRTSSFSTAREMKATCLHVSPPSGFRQDKLYPRFLYDALKNEASVHAFGKNGDSKSENEPFSLESPKEATGNFRRELTVQDLLREWMKGRQFGGNGGDGNSFGGDGDRSGGPETVGSAGQSDELFQVIMATIGVIFLYTLITSGEELIRLARDYIKYLLGAKASARLIHTMEKWRKFFEIVAPKGVL